MIPGQDISVTRPVGQAIDRVKLVLFQPFDLTKWMVIGFTAFLAYLGQSGGFAPNFNFGHRATHGENGDWREAVEHVRTYVAENLYWLLPVIIAIFVVSLALGVLVTWLSSRGRFMFLHCVALNRAEVRYPWNLYADQANS